MLEVGGNSEKEVISEMVLGFPRHRIANNLEFGEITFSLFPSTKRIDESLKKDENFQCYHSIFEPSVSSPHGYYSLFLWICWNFDKLIELSSAD